MSSITDQENGYVLVDSGEGEKLERFGQFLLSRPDPQAIWQKSLPKEEWQKSHATFISGVNKWKIAPGVPRSWVVDMGGLKFKINLSFFKHTGVFPEHINNWEWIENKLKAKSQSTRLQGGKSKVLNLFGYTGGATLAAARGNAEVVHLDASKPSVALAKENAELSQLGSAPIRYIVDDAKRFLKREINRGNKYEGIILDPPSFGRGVKGEVWKIERDLLPFLLSCKQVLSPKPTFVLLNGYASGYSPLSYAQILSSIFDLPISEIEAGELLIKENNSRGFSLPAGIFARWSSK